MTPASAATAILRRRRGLAIACALLLATGPGELSATVRVNAIRVGLDPEHSRLVLESDQPIRARMTRDPRTGVLFIDLDDVALDATLAGLAKVVGANNPFVTDVDLYRRGNATRLALAVPAAVIPRLFHLRPGDGHADRLVVDFHRTSPIPMPTGPMPTGPVAEGPGVGTVRTPPPPVMQEVDRVAPDALPHRSRTHVTAVRSAVASDRIRLVLESDRPIQASITHPTEPGGPLAIVLDDVALDTVLAELPGKLGRNPYLTSIRFGAEGAGTRMELVTPAPATPQIFHIAPVDGHGDRLVVDIFPDQTLPPPLPPPVAPTAPAVMAASPAPAPATPSTESPPTTTDIPTESLLEVHVNGTVKDTVLVLQDAAGQVLVRAADLQRWRIHVTTHSTVRHGTDDYTPLAGIDGLSYRVDSARGTLQLDVSPSRFDATRFSGISSAADEPTPSPPGAYLNYDVFAARGAHASSTASALVETGLFGRWGSGTNIFLARHLPGDNRGVRLDTVWSYDRPAEMATLRLGDTISAPSSWGRGVRFGGVQWGTNFATRPDFITFPMPSLHGIAAAPSTVDFYVNNALRLRRDVPSGPFTIQDLPVVTGQGEIRLVVRDLLGREQVLTQPFYASGGLLAKGLRDFSYEAGFERENYGLASNDYGRFVASATERRGFSDSFTGELHAEAMRDQQTVGLGGNLLLGTLGVLSASVAGSHSASGTGALLGLGLQHQSGYLSYGARTQFTTAGFAQLGYPSPLRPPRQTTTAFMSFGMGSLGSLGMNYTRQDLRGQQDIELLGANYNHSLGQLGYLSLSALRFLGGDASPLLTLTLTMPLGSNDSVSVNGQSQDGRGRGAVQYQRNLPTGTGVGYRMQAGFSADDPRLVGINAQNDTGTYAFDMASIQGQHAYQASVRGGLVLLAGKLFSSRHIDDSFAVVRVPGFANVHVYADNQPVATTDDDGYALVPRLRPYQKNPIRIEQADLPMDAEIKGLQLDAVPYYHSALALTFPVSRSHGAIVTIKLRDGSFLPAGAEVALAGSREVFPVGRYGEVYLTGLTESNQLHVTWQQQSCDLSLSFPETTDPLPRLGPATCQGIDP